MEENDSRYKPEENFKFDDVYDLTKYNDGPSNIIVNPFAPIRMSLTRDVKTPQRGTENSAGIDFFIPNEWNDGFNYTIEPGEQVVIPAGVHVDLMGSGLNNYMLNFMNKSGVATKRGLLIGACVIDADYQGEVHINLHNVSKKPVNIVAGEKIAQAILIPVVYLEPNIIEFDELYSNLTERGTGGFGSTGG